MTVQQANYVAAKLTTRVLSRAFSAPTGRGGVSTNPTSGIVRFYKAVGVETVDNSLFSVTLDGKKLKTPGRKRLQVASKRLAYAIAHEWDAQKSLIRASTMPLMTLVSTVHDGIEKNDIIDEMLHYLKSDTLCYQVTLDQQEKLAKLQQKQWNPLRKWFNENFDGEIDVMHGTFDPLRHDDATLRTVRNFLQPLDELQLVALRSLTKECKSLIASLALFKGRITAKEAMEISRVEEEFQIGRWGLVEGGHDVDRVNCSLSISSASFLLRLLAHERP